MDLPSGVRAEWKPSEELIRFDQSRQSMPPDKQIEATLREGHILKCDPAGDHGLGNHGVGIGEARFRPRPGCIVVRFGQTGGVVGEQCPGGTVSRVCGEEFGCSQRRERHRPGPG